MTAMAVCYQFYFSCYTGPEGPEAAPLLSKQHRYYSYKRPFLVQDGVSVIVGLLNLLCPSSA